VAQKVTFQAAMIVRSISNSVIGSASGFDGMIEGSNLEPDHGFHLPNDHIGENQATTCGDPFTACRI
jgi:hypothetical protein